MVACFGIWYLFNDLYDSHRILEQSFSQVICLFLHLFPFNVRCWTFDVRCSFFSVRPVQKQTSNTEHSTTISFQPSGPEAVLILVTKILINSSVSSCFPIQHSMLDVRCSMFIFFSPLGTPLPGLHHGLDKVKFPILTIGPQHGCLLWYLVPVQRSL